MSFSKNEVHTVENILKKLDSDLPDSERESFLKILLNSASTFILLLEVSIVWQANLCNTQIQIATLKEKIRFFQIGIDMAKKYQYEEEEIESFEKHIQSCHEELNQVQSTFEISQNHAKKSQELIAPFLDKYRTITEQKEASQNDYELK